MRKDIAHIYIANTIIGTLLHNSPGEIFVLNIEEFDKANNTKIVKAFDKL